MASILSQREIDQLVIDFKKKLKRENQIMLKSKHT